MGNILSEISTALRDLGAQFEAHGNSGLIMTQHYGWNTPPLALNELGEMAKNLAEKLEKIPASSISAKFDSGPLLERIAVFRGNTFGYMINSNASGAVGPYLALLSYIDQKFSPLYERRVDWEKYNEEGLLPRQISTKLRGYKASISRFDQEFGALGDKIELINQAHEAANELPADLETLRSANEEILEKKTEAERSLVLAEAAREKSEAALARIEAHALEAQKLVENTEDAYSAATTKGLGEVFQRRADSLSTSMWMWVCLLFIALLSGGILGHLRLQVIQELVQENATDGKIWLNFALAVVALAAPVWFAWISTKQIGHRFRLSEDYAFKASVAQAYEGYRREAARLDSAFASRLFASALDRIDEAPIRFVEMETHGSPWHEFLKFRNKRSAEDERPIIVPTIEKKSPVARNSQHPRSGVSE